MKSEMSSKYRYEQTEQLMRQIKKQCLNCGTDLTENVYHDLLCNECRKDGYEVKIEINDPSEINGLAKQIIIFIAIILIAMTLESIFNFIS